MGALAVDLEGGNAGGAHDLTEHFWFLVRTARVEARTRMIMVSVERGGQGSLTVLVFVQFGEDELFVGRVLGAGSFGGFSCFAALCRYCLR